MDGALIDALIIITSLRPECTAYTNFRYRNLVQVADGSLTMLLWW